MQTGDTPDRLPISLVTEQKVKQFMSEEVPIEDFQTEILETLKQYFLTFCPDGELRAGHFIKLNEASQLIRECQNKEQLSHIYRVYLVYLASTQNLLQKVAVMPS